MITGRFFSLFILIGAGLVGCTAVPDPTPSPQTLAGEGVTVAATRRACARMKVKYEAENKDTATLQIW